MGRITLKRTKKYRKSKVKQCSKCGRFLKKNK